MSSSNPYMDRMNAIARLRTEKLKIEAQIGDEIAKAWRLSSDAVDLDTFASNLGMIVDDVRQTLWDRGIRVRA